MYFTLRSTVSIRRTRGDYETATSCRTFLDQRRPERDITPPKRLRVCSIAHEKGSNAKNNGVRIASLLIEQPLQVMRRTNEEHPRLLDLDAFRRV